MLTADVISEAVSGKPLVHLSLKDVASGHFQRLIPARAAECGSIKFSEAFRGCSAMGSSEGGGSWVELTMCEQPRVELRSTEGIKVKLPKEVELKAWLNRQDASEVVAEPHQQWQL